MQGFLLFEGVFFLLGQATGHAAQGAQGVLYILQQIFGVMPDSAAYQPLELIIALGNQQCRIQRRRQRHIDGLLGRENG